MTLSKIISRLHKHSYGRFVLENRKATRIERQKALKRFLDFTRESYVKK